MVLYTKYPSINFYYLSHLLPLFSFLSSLFIDVSSIELRPL